VVALVVVGSIVIHGITATPVMARLDRRRVRAAGPDEPTDVDVARTPV
jgi:hypothetical protein